MGTQKQSSKERETSIGILTGTKLDMLCKQVFVFNTRCAPQMLITPPIPLMQSTQQHGRRASALHC